MSTTLSREALEQRRTRAIRDLVETQQQLESGEIDEDTAARLTKIYESEVVAALEGLDELGPAPQPDRINKRVLLIGGAMIVACVIIAALATGALKPRKAGQAITGSTPGSTVRDLSSVSNEEMEAVIKQNPGIIPMRLALAERYIRDNQLDKAMGHINIALSQQPSTEDRARALRDRGWTTHLEGHSADGAKDLEQALQLVPDEPNTEFWLAEVRLDGLHDPKGAIPLLERLVQTQQNDPEALKNVQAVLDRAKAAATAP